jgi:hypothetical protein
MGSGFDVRIYWRFFKITVNYDSSESMTTRFSPYWTTSVFPSTVTNHCSHIELPSDFWFESESQSYVTTDGQSASLSWTKASNWDLRLDFYYCQTVAGLLMWGALSDERTGLSFTIAAVPRQGSHSRGRVP